jgi:hypothetical protein
MRKKIHEVTDVTKLQGMVIDLWSYLDHIDTLEDLCKGNLGAFERLVRDTHKKRFDVLESDGYALYLPTIKTPLDTNTEE